jgi:preprotein translocase subunit SecA
MLKNKNVNINDVITDDVQREINNKKKHFENFYHHPKFLEGFLNFQSQKWIDTAYDSKNLYRNNREYITTSQDYQGKKIVQPIDYKNTGEIQKNTIFQNGLHQMLQIKHKLRFHPERLSHTFLSYISYFHKFKKTDEFLFFGLTGTIGDESTQEIYKSDNIDSRILFIPEHRRKRFIELPPLIAKDENEHIDKICNDIILNYSKGRKILVICETIQEALDLEKELKHNDNFKNDKNIGMFIKNDKIDDGFKTKQIIISTNLGGRGQDFETSEIEENVGGMHVIITKLSKNIRVQNQAFGRTARKGKKGTGIIIFKNSKYNSYEEKKAHRNENEINSINKKLK